MCILLSLWPTLAYHPVIPILGEHAKQHLKPTRVCGCDRYPGSELQMAVDAIFSRFYPLPLRIPLLP